MAVLEERQCVHQGAVDEVGAAFEVVLQRHYGYRYCQGAQGARAQNARLKRLLAEAELEKEALREVAKGKF
ncbi:hypothetical protein [Mycolicibacterium rhodesiae]|uniref:hypothetical protein n=1 Tax=Mycolicibacterium rhodesiae TaxID=36814 RepID=UPI001055D6FC|nr:hypothetical protein [Mycolicibacterium rhodesiae]